MRAETLALEGPAFRRFLFAPIDRHKVGRILFPARYLIPKTIFLLHRSDNRTSVMR